MVMDPSLDTEDSSVNMMQVDNVEQAHVVADPLQINEAQVNTERAIVPFIPLAQPWLPSANVVQGSQQIRLFLPVYGPVLPPEMIWKRMFESLMPELLTMHVPLSLQFPKAEPVVLSKRSWDIAFDIAIGFKLTLKV